MFFQHLVILPIARTIVIVPYHHSYHFVVVPSIPTILSPFSLFHHYLCCYVAIIVIPHYLSPFPITISIVSLFFHHLLSLEKMFPKHKTPIMNLSFTKVTQLLDVLDVGMSS
jgi:hypothetical protein